MDFKYTDFGCWTQYPDGAGYGAYPHATEHYDIITQRCGYVDRMTYCREHEFCHHFVSVHILNQPHSHVVWQLAHNLPVDPGLAVSEEALVHLFQRWLRADERPIIGGVDWDGLKDQAKHWLTENHFQIQNLCG